MFTKRKSNNKNAKLTTLHKMQLSLIKTNKKNCNDIMTKKSDIKTNRTKTNDQQLMRKPKIPKEIKQLEYTNLKKRFKKL